VVKVFRIARTNNPCPYLLKETVVRIPVTNGLFGLGSALRIAGFSKFYISIIGGQYFLLGTGNFLQFLHLWSFVSHLRIKVCNDNDQDTCTKTADIYDQRKYVEIHRLKFNWTQHYPVIEVLFKFETKVLILYMFSLI